MARRASVSRMRDDDAAATGAGVTPGGRSDVRRSDQLRKIRRCVGSVYRDFIVGACDHHGRDVEGYNPRHMLQARPATSSQKAASRQRVLSFRVGRVGAWLWIAGCWYGVTTVAGRFGASRCPCRRLVRDCRRSSIGRVRDLSVRQEPCAGPVKDQTAAEDDSDTQRPCRHGSQILSQWPDVG
jgi:hypothetical protein